MDYNTGFKMVHYKNRKTKNIVKILMFSFLLLISKEGGGALIRGVAIK